MNKLKKYSLLCLCLLFPVIAQAGIKDTLKSGLSSLCDAVPGGGAVKKFFGLSPEEKTAELMEEQVSTSKNFLDEMKEAANSMKKLKENIQQANSIKNDGKRLLEDVSKAKYGKVVLGISEQISGISLDPSTYIPDLECTRDLKRDSSFSYYREKSLLSRIDYFTNRSSNFLSTKTPKSLNSLCREVQQELRRSDQIKTAAKESNHKLIPIYQAQIKNLEIQNKRIDKILSTLHIKEKTNSKDDKFKLDDPVKYFQLEEIKNNNIMRMGELVERINKIRVDSEKVSKEDKKAISELYSEKIDDDLTRYIIQSKIDRNNKA